MDNSETGTNNSGHTRPVHVEIRPRDTYQHHVTVEQAGSIISWSFFTRRKNVAFGLFYLHTNLVPDDEGRGSNTSSPRRSLTASRSNETLRAGNIKEAIMASRATVNVQPPASPKPGHGTTSVPSSRANSVQPNAPLGDRTGATSITTSHPLHDGEDSSEGGLSRARTVDSRPTGFETLMRQQNSSLPDLRAYATPSSMSAQNASEYIEILPVERYESFESTITGQYVAPTAGTYILYFDNTYSFNTSKELFLTVSTGPSVPTSQEAFSGWMLKKKQRRLQGWARRWFQLNRKGILSYYEDRFSPCRGSVDLHHCTITKTPHRLMMTIDSGRATYHLRAFSSEDYALWSEQFNLIRVQSTMEGFAAGSEGGVSGSVATNAAIISFSERLVERLKNSESLITDLRLLAGREDDGNVKFLGPLEMTFQSLHELYEMLSEYAVFLQRTGRRMSVAGLEGARSPLNAPAASIDEFFDAEEIILSELSEEDEEDEDDNTLFSSREVVSVAPSEFTTEYSAAFESLLSPMPAVEAVSEVPVVVPGELQGFRRRMPRLAPPCNISLSSILRKSIGKDWSAMPMPVGLNEPLSALQRMCEELEYSQLLDEAARCTSPIDRLIKVAAFAVSAYAATVHRADRKPFTPILGETFEYERLDRGYRFIAEKISHRPLIFACHAQSEQKWSFWQDQRVKNKFWGKSMEYMPVGNVHVYFADTGDHFVWNKVITCVRNLIMGTKFVENYGDMMMRNVRTGDTATIVLKPNSGGLFSGKSAVTNEVMATIIPARDGPDSGMEPIILRGRWDSMLCREQPGREPTLVWRAAPVPNDHMEYFGFTEFAISLNDLPDWLQPHLPLTDSRRRPDQRMLEDNRLEEAEQLKPQLELRQREHRQGLEDAGLTWEPVWFKFEPPTAEDPEGAWRVKDPAAYWECRRTRQWPSSIHALW